MFVMMSSTPAPSGSSPETASVASNRSQASEDLTVSRNEIEDEPVSMKPEIQSFLREVDLNANLNQPKPSFSANDNIRRDREVMRSRHINRVGYDRKPYKAQPESCLPFQSRCPALPGVYFQGRSYQRISIPNNLRHEGY